MSKGDVIPYYYEFQEELPYTPNGKVDFKKVQNDDIEKLNISSKKNKGEI